MFLRLDQVSTTMLQVWIQEKKIQKKNKRKEKSTTNQLPKKTM